MSYEANKKWRQTHRVTRNAGKARYYDRFPGSVTVARTLWTEAEDERIMDPAKPSDAQLSLVMGRSVRAIQNRRYVLRSAR